MKFPRIVHNQPEFQAVDIAHWRTDEEFGIHPVGSKPKKMVVAPSDTDLPFIIPDHSYLFKSALGWREQQIWSEVIAYRIGKLVDLPIPPSFIAYDSTTGETGVLVEFFFGYPGEESPARLVHGVDAIASIFRSQEIGKPHTVQSNAKVTRIMLGQSFGMDWWSSAYAFDALIANTDRHTENWGFLVRRTSAGETTYEIAPLYDNGTSLGFQLPEAQLRQRSTTKALAQFNQAGRHQCGWDIQNDQPMGHFELCEKLLDSYPGSAKIIEKVIGFDMGDADDILRQCTTYSVPVAFTAERAEFMSALLQSRRERLLSLL
ncbi:HipA domain-containing protein [Sinorhizobium meliloti]|uniref:hypothetical protein n=1 Tax=Rhizobium meliloti TaxID=382 RepID=UPI000FD7CC83|nr:hypothetical protein [Sinorhizobium meliloti]RVH27880.1 hypothetical protein CN211_26485 [Sinorhizobium meliloti]